MIPFCKYFPELGAKETRCAYLGGSQQGAPAGKYMFLELYCDDVDCDCRRVLFKVIKENDPDNKVLATINYGWESLDFYARKLGGDKKMAWEVITAILDPLNPQSEYAEEFLEIFRNTLLTDPDYIARLVRHYEMFKKAVKEKAIPTDVVHPVDMSADEIIKQLSTVGVDVEFAPYSRALAFAGNHKEELVPRLIDAIEDVIKNPKAYERDRRRSLFKFAIVLLAEFRETRALDCLTRLFCQSAAATVYFMDEIGGEEWETIFASFCGGNVAPLFQIIQNESTDPYIRSLAVGGLGVQYFWDERTRAELVKDLRTLLQTLPKSQEFNAARAGIADIVCNFNIGELADEVRQAFDNNLMATEYMDRDYFEAVLEEDPQFNLDEYKDLHEPVRASFMCNSFNGFADEEEDWDLPENLIAPPDRILPSSYGAPEPFIAPPKTGRNDPCPCGSGKKYKKCCGQ